MVQGNQYRYLENIIFCLKADQSPMPLHHGLHGLDSQAHSFSFGGVIMAVFLTDDPVKAIVCNKTKLLPACLAFQNDEVPSVF